MTNIALVGNCQTWPLSEMFVHACADVDVIGKIVVYQSTEDDESADMELLERSDIILTQLITDTFAIPYIQTTNLKSLFGDKVITVPNLFFHGQNPDQFYVYGEDRVRIQGPCAEYHSKSLIESWKAGRSVEEISEQNYISSNFDNDYMSTVIEKSFTDFASREQSIDIPMGDYLRSHWQEQPLFHTFNHPTPEALKALFVRFCDYAGIAYDNEKLIEIAKNDRLGAIHPPMEITLSEQMGMSFSIPTEVKGVGLDETTGARIDGEYKKYSFREYVEHSYRCYDRHSDIMNSLSFTPS